MTKYHKAGWLINNINVFLTVVEAAKSKIWPRQLWSLVRAYFLVYRRHLYALSSQGRRDGGSLRPYLWELQSPSWGFHLHYLNNLPVVLFLNTAILLRISTHEFWEDTNTRCTVVSNIVYTVSVHPPIHLSIHTSTHPSSHLPIHPLTHISLSIDHLISLSFYILQSEKK